MIDNLRKMRKKTVIFKLSKYNSVKELNFVYFLIEYLHENSLS
jgi:hypothetical protein